MILFARVKRYLFDYNDPTVMDEAVRGIIPFWTWMSRNLPLQIVNKFSNPKAYVIYNHFIQNIAGEPIANMPTWMQESGAVPIGGMNVLMMDTPTQAASNLITDIQKPSSLLEQPQPWYSGTARVFCKQEVLHWSKLFWKVFTRLTEQTRLSFRCLPRWVNYLGTAEVNLLHPTRVCTC